MWIRNLNHIGDNMRQTGVVEKVYEKDGRYSIVVANEWYSFNTFKPSCTEGDVVEFEFTKRGKYNNADHKSLVVVNPSASPAAAAAVSVHGNKQDIISYQAARNSAIAFMGICLHAGAVVVPKKEADRFDNLKGLLYDLTEEFFKSSQNLGPIDGAVNVGSEDTPAWEDE